MKNWNDTVTLHDSAVAGYATAATDTVARWHDAPAPGKWTPAQVTDHLCKAFEAIIAEARGGPPMALRLKAWQRFVAHWTIYQRLLRGGAFPHGAPAPRETRPDAASGDAVAAIARFRTLGAEVVEVTGQALQKNPGLQFRHPYFGYVRASDGMYVSARHIDHHRAQITRGAE